jgi:hypothetical protein
MARIGWVTICKVSMYVRCESCAFEFEKDPTLLSKEIPDVGATKHFRFVCAGCLCEFGHGSMKFCRVFNPQYARDIYRFDQSLDHIAEDDEWEIIKEAYEQR